MSWVSSVRPGALGNGCNMMYIFLGVIFAVCGLFCVAGAFIMFAPPDRSVFLTTIMAVTALICFGFGVWVSDIPSGEGNTFESTIVGFDYRDGQYGATYIIITEADHSCAVAPKVYFESELGDLISYNWRVSRLGWTNECTIIRTSK